LCATSFSQRFVANVPVILKIRRLPGAGVAGELARAVACLRRAAQRALNVAFAFQDMQWKNFVVSAKDRIQMRHPARHPIHKRHPSGEMGLKT
jgi:hypothetical protein